MIPIEEGETQVWDDFSLPELYSSDTGFLCILGNLAILPFKVGDTPRDRGVSQRTVLLGTFTGITAVLLLSRGITVTQATLDRTWYFVPQKCFRKF